MAKALFPLAGLWIGMLGSSVGGSTSLEKEATQLTDVMCYSGDTPIITKAYYLHQPNPSPCDNKCQPNTTSLKNSNSCFYDDERRCKIRFRLDDLNRIYTALDSGDREQSKKTSEDIENDRTKGRYKVKYVCVAGRTVDPCTDLQDNNSNNNDNVTNLLVTPSLHQSVAGSSCHKLCRLTPLDEGPLKLVINFLLNDTRREDDSYLQYHYVMNSAEHAARWSNMTSSYHYDNDTLFTDVKEIQVRLHLEDLSLVTRLWISLQGNAFTVKCEEEGQTDGTNDPVSASLTTQPELSTQDTLDTEKGGALGVTGKEEEQTVYTDDSVSASLTTQPELSTQDTLNTASLTTQPELSTEDTLNTELEGNPVLPYVIGASAVLAAIFGIGLYIYYIRKRRPFEEVSSKQETQLSTVRASHQGDLTHQGDVTHHGDATHHDDDTAGSSRAQNLTTGDYCQVDVPNETGRGNDDGEYGRLDRDGRRNEVGATAGDSDVYNHVAPLQPAASQQHPSSQQEAEVYDRLHRHPERQVVVDNVCDSTR